MPVLNDLPAVTDMPAVHCFSTWRDLVCNSLIELECLGDDEQPFRGQMVMFPFGRSLAGRIASTRHRVSRRPRRGSCGPGDFIMLTRINQGSMRIEQGGRHAVVRPGEMVLYDSTRPYSIQIDDYFEQVVLRVDRQVFQQFCGDVENQTAIAFGQGSGQYLSHFMAELKPEAVASHSALHAAFLNLVSGALPTLRDSELPATTLGRHAIRQRAVEFVEMHLGDEGLSCAAVAAKMQVNERYLRRLFSEQGEPLSARILRRRLEEASRQLQSASVFKESIATIAYRCGFKRVSHFNRAFRGHHGMTPSQLRAMAQERR